MVHWFHTVSYTHLDVYKRQHYEYVKVGRRTFFHLDVVGWPRVIPVSYTHLDVYKRQIYVKTNASSLLNKSVISFWFTLMIIEKYMASITNNIVL